MAEKLTVQQIEAALDRAQALSEQGDLEALRDLLESLYPRSVRDLGPEHPTTLEVAGWLGSIRYECGELEGARELQEFAYSTSTQMLGDEHPDTLTAAHSLGQTLYAQGDYPGARKHQETVYATCHTILGDEHPDTLATAHNLGLTLYAQRDYPGARKLQETVYATCRTILGDEHPKTLATAHNLAQTLSAQGDYQAARKVQEAVLATTRKLFGDEHPATLTAAANLLKTLQTMDDLARTLFEQGDLAGARKLQESVYATSRQVLGDEHADTLWAGRHLGMILCALGNPAGARQLLEVVYQVSQKVLGPEHPDTLLVAINLAWSLYLLSDLDGARKLQEFVYATSQKTLGGGHPDTLTAGNNLAQTLRAQGDYARARKLQAFVCTTFRKSFGNEDPRTLLLVSNLAVVLSASGYYGRARKLQAFAYAMSGKLLGSEHGQTLKAGGSLAVIMHDQGDLDGARKLQEALLATSRNVFGDEHPNTLVFAGNLARTVFAQGDHASARELQETLLATSRKVLGDEHRHVLSAAHNLAVTRLAQGDHAGAAALAWHTLQTLAMVDDVGPIIFQSAYGLLDGVLAPAIRYRDEISVSLPPAWRDELPELLLRVSGNLQRHLELRGADAADTVVSDYAAFHRSWFLVCALVAPQRMPQALAPLHGLEAWFGASNQLLRQQQAGDTLNPRQNDFLEAREALTRLRAQIAHIDGQIVRVSEDSASLDRAIVRPGKRPLPDDERYRLQQAKERNMRVLDTLREQRQESVRQEQVAATAYAGAREALADADPTFAAGVRPPTETADDYLATLAPEDGLLILDQVREDVVVAVAMTGSGTVQLVELPDLRRLAVENDAFLAEFRGTHGAGGLRDYRCFGPGSAAPVTVAPLGERYVAALQEIGREVFWARLSGTFPEVRRWQIVSGPGLHSLPFDLARPDDLVAHYYCGLPAYRRLREAPAPSPALPPRLDLTVDAAWNTGFPIPFSEAEASVTQRLFARFGPATQRLEGREFLAAPALGPGIQLACHGLAEGHGDQAYGVLVLDGQTLDPGQAAYLPGKITEFLASACLGGVVSFTQGGDAQGIVSALQLRGTASVIACLAPVPDFYMPLLVAFYWYQRRAGALPHDALAIAKQQLRTGDWPADLLPILREVYVDQMLRVLDRARADHAPTPTDGVSARAIAGTVKSWLLSDEVRDEYFVAPMDVVEHQRFSAAWCEDPGQRQKLAQAVAERLIRERHAFPSRARAAIEQLCAYTVHFGQ